MDGRCICGALRYRLMEPPMFTQCCHCSWCQRETGSAFAVNALIETARVEVDGPIVERSIPSASGRGQILVQCAGCGTTIYGHYGGGGRAVAFVRTGTLDDPAAFPPDIHIYTATRRPWVLLPPDVPAVPEYYRASEYWPAASLARRDALRASQQVDRPDRS